MGEIMRNKFPALRLNDKTQSNIARHTGLTIKEIREKFVSAVDEHLESKAGKKIEVAPQRDKRLLGRGSVLLNRLKTRREIDAAIEKI